MKNDSAFETFGSTQELVADSTLKFPPLMLEEPSDDESSDKQNVWAYLAENVNEFEVAKTIVDFVEANSKLLTDKNVTVDLLGLHVLAKVTLKRQAVAYAKDAQAKASAEQAIAAAREQSRSIGNQAKSLGQHIAAALRVIRSDSSQQFMLAFVAVTSFVSWMR